ncbi:Serine decarboxylase, partial [Mucuna pruriens]
MQCVKVRTLVSGEIDCIDLKALLIEHKDKPAIINLNIGKTMKGGVDNLDLVIQTLEGCGFTRDRFYIHLMELYLELCCRLSKQAPRITFMKPIGSELFLAISSWDIQFLVVLDVEYIASRDVTITGRRCGHAPIFLWYATKIKCLIGIQDEVHKCIMNARYLQHQLRDAGIGAMLNEFSNIVAFERPPDEDFIRRWNLACNGKIAHVLVMQHVTIEMLDSFVAEFLQKRWFQPLCIASDIGSGNCACSMQNSKLRFKRTSVQDSHQ